MPTPIAPGVIRAQTVFQGKTGLPEDRFVTTLHFVTPSGTVEGAQLQRAAARVATFWTTAGSGGVALTSYLGAQVTRGTTAGQVRCYDLGAAEPRQPTISTFAIAGSDPTTSYPAEVAICASFSGPIALPRFRGRIYMGPLSTGTAGVVATTGRVAVNATVRLALADKMAELAVGTASELARWVVYSPTNNATTFVTKGYVDDAYDTQRRRGLAPVGRTSWTS